MAIQKAALSGYSRLVKGVTIIACEVLRDEIAAVAGDVPVQFVPGRLHFHHDQLRQELAQRFARVPEGDTILLAYGRCALGAGRLEAASHRLVLPAVDNCVALLLGSGAAYRRELRGRPGSLYYTRGWTDGMDDPYRMYVQAVERLGEEAARRWAGLLFSGYSRIALVETDSLPAEQARAYAGRVAAASGLPLQTIRGSLTLIEKLLQGPWDDDFVVVEPGGILDDSTFWRRERLRRTAGANREHDPADPEPVFAP